MPADYAVLASIYDRAGLSRHTQELIPQVFSFAQMTHEWVGRRILDVGTGTGQAAFWLSKRGFNVTAVDNSEEMLHQAKYSFDTSGLGLMWREADLRTLDASFDITDMVIALDVVNDLNSLKDLEAMISTAYRVLDHGKMLIFDMITIEGLAQRDRTSGEIFSNDDLTVFANYRFDYDRQTSTANYSIFKRDRSFWLRENAGQTLRGYPVQVVQALLTRAGFTVVALTDMTFHPYDPTASRGDRVLFLARKPDVAGGAG